jgi:hypothetical protein
VVSRAIVLDVNANRELYPLCRSPALSISAS